MACVGWGHPEDLLPLKVGGIPSQSHLFFPFEANSSCPGSRWWVPASDSSGTLLGVKATQRGAPGAEQRFPAKLPLTSSDKVKDTALRPIPVISVPYDPHESCRASSPVSVKGVETPSTHKQIIPNHKPITHTRARMNRKLSSGVSRELPAGVSRELYRADTTPNGLNTLCSYGKLQKLSIS